jgi:aspartyl-tRNA(Asn)/glutamyl-tRNA(Gln) amidotransferase subunit B
MLGCQIATRCKFDRKNYFYPDMPKNYQISQYDEPLCLGGAVPLDLLAYPKDAQKGPATVPTSRCGWCASTSRRTWRSRSTSRRHQRHRFQPRRDAADGNRQRGRHVDAGGGLRLSLRAQANPDLRRRERRRHGKGADALRRERFRPSAGQAEFGTKCELKNLNSISGVRRALKYEIARQIDVVTSGGTIEQQTRRWDDDKGETTLMRTKEKAHDYRYFPDPDIQPVRTEYKGGKTASINFLKGQVMKLSQGKANPNVVSEVLARKLAE